AAISDYPIYLMTWRALLTPGTAGELYPEYRMLLVELAKAYGVSGTVRIEGATVHFPRIPHTEAVIRWRVLPLISWLTRITGRVAAPSGRNTLSFDFTTHELRDILKMPQWWNVVSGKSPFNDAEVYSYQVWTGSRDGHRHAMLYELALAVRAADNSLSD